MNEAELLFSDTLNYERQKLYLNADIILDSNQRHIISQALKRRIEGEPIQYILGKTEFMGLEFKLNRDVFIPRPETEIVVETVIKIVVSGKSSVISKKILDLGTGCGCIAVSLAKLIPEAEITALDISEKALKVAKINAELNNVKINFVLGNLLNTYDLQLNTYDLIVSNPPYIPSHEIEDLPREVNYEPRLALDGGRDGLDFYRQIISDSPHYLKQDGLLIMEMGYRQKEGIEKIFQKSDNFKIIGIIKDYSNIDRVIVAKRKGRDG